MKSTELIEKCDKMYSAHKSAQFLLENYIEDNLCYVKQYKNYSIRFTVFQDEKFKPWFYDVIIKKNNRKIRNLDWIDLPKNVIRYYKLFSKIGDEWLLGRDINFLYRKIKDASNIRIKSEI